jgi:hypothetical protein
MTLYHAIYMSNCIVYINIVSISNLIVKSLNLLSQRLFLVYMVSQPTNSQHSSMANTTAAPVETNPLMPNVTQLGGIKLEGPNYLGWVAQIQPILCGYEL